MSQSYINDTEQLKQDVQRSLRPEQFKSLLVGTNETVVVISESTRALSKGAAVLVSETGRNGASQHALAPLAPYLNKFGWTTIMVTAPRMIFEAETQDATESDATESQATENSNTSPDSAPDTAPDSAPTNPNDMPPPNQIIPSYTSTDVITDTMFEQQEQAFQLLMNAMEQERQNYPGFFVLIAQGTSAAWLSKLYGDGTLRDEPDAVVTLGVSWPQHDLNQQVPDIIAQTPFPVLDLFNQFDSDWTKNTAQLRQVAANKSLKLHYRQREIIGPRFDHYQYEYLTREIHGWLTYMGW